MSIITPSRIVQSTLRWQSAMSVVEVIWLTLYNLKPSTYADGLYLLGLFLAFKWVYKTLSGLYIAFKTYALPLVWKRNFKKEYGEWAGKF